MNANIRSIACAVLVVAYSGAIALGQVPGLLTYHGEITENDCLAEGVYSMEFSIWSSLTG